MHAIIFSSSLESPTGRAPPLGVLEARGGAELDQLTAGDVVWVVQRMPGARQTPGLCGRVVVGAVEGMAGLAEGFGARARRIVPDERASRRCEPFACLVVHTWGVWRRHYEGAVLLTEEQARTLEDAWLERHGEGGDWAGSGVVA